MGVGDEVGRNTMVDHLEEAMLGTCTTHEPYHLVGGIRVAGKEAPEVDDGDDELLRWPGLVLLRPDELGRDGSLVVEDGCIKHQWRRTRR